MGGTLRKYMDGDGLGPDDYGRVDDAGFPVAADGALYLNPADLSASQARWRYAGAVVTLINRDCDSTCEGIAKTD